MDIDDLVRKLNKSIEQHYDIIWQEDWYDFYDDGMNLVKLCLRPHMPHSVVHAAKKLAPRLEEGGDCPFQEEWFDICEGVFMLTVELCNERMVPTSLLGEFPYFYEVAL